MSSIEDWLEIYKHELKGLYSGSEIRVIFYILCAEYLGFSTPGEAQFHHDQKVSIQVCGQLDAALTDLKTGKPYQQIIGKAWFFGEEFLVDENTLIPRPETEELVELALSKINRSNLQILDIGTGSGCIAITLSKRLQNAVVTGIDLSHKALAIARENAMKLQTKVDFSQLDYLKETPTRSFNVIISNPPYIAQNEKSEIPETVKDFEPAEALFSPTDDPLIFYRKIATDLSQILKPNGYLFLEINQKLGNKTLELFKEKLAEVHLIKDISGNDRMIWGRK